MDWILSNIGPIIAIVVFAMIARGVTKVLRQAAEEQSKQAKRKAALDPDAVERTRRVQEEIRRTIAARRAGGALPTRPARPAPESSPLQRIPPLARPLGVPPIDTFGGPTRRVPTPAAPEPVEELAREAEPEEATIAILERQRQLQEQMRALEGKRLAEQRRAAVLTETRQAESVATAKAVPIARRELVADLRDTRALRRTILLREILGTPVGLR